MARFRFLGRALFPERSFSISLADSAARAAYWYSPFVRWNFTRSHNEIVGNRNHTPNLWVLHSFLPSLFWMSQRFIVMMMINTSRYFHHRNRLQMIRIVFMCFPYFPVYSESVRLTVGVGRLTNGSWNEEIDDRVDLVVTIVARTPDCVKPSKVSAFRQLFRIRAPRFTYLIALTCIQKRRWERAVRWYFLNTVWTLRNAGRCARRDIVYLLIWRLALVLPVGGRVQ